MGSIFDEAVRAEAAHLEVRIVQRPRERGHRRAVADVAERARGVGADEVGLGLEERLELRDRLLVTPLADHDDDVLADQLVLVAQRDGHERVERLLPRDVPQRARRCDTDDSLRVLEELREDRDRRRVAEHTQRLSGRDAHRGHRIGRHARTAPVAFFSPIWPSDSRACTRTASTGSSRIAINESTAATARASPRRSAASARIVGSSSASSLYETLGRPEQPTVSKIAAKVNAAPRTPARVSDMNNLVARVLRRGTPSGSKAQARTRDYTPRPSCRFGTETHAPGPPHRRNPRNPALSGVRRQRRVHRGLQGVGPGPVRYLVSREEEREFKKLDSDDARASFVERFWSRRDPTPDTWFNEYRQTFWRRVTDANEKFLDSAGPGWKTDRGKIYILYGPPERIQEDSGADVQGLEPTATRGLLRWIYESRPGGRMDLPDTVVVPFVRTITGEFKLSSDPRLASIFFDPLLLGDRRSPNAWDRYRVESAGSGTRLDVMLDLGKMQEVPPQEQVLLERVETRETYAQRPLSVRLDRYPLDGASGTLTVVTLDLPPSDDSPAIVVRFTSRDAARAPKILAEGAFRIERDAGARLAQGRVTLEPGTWDVLALAVDPRESANRIWKGSLAISGPTAALRLSDPVLASRVEPLEYRGLTGYDAPYTSAASASCPACPPPSPAESRSRSSSRPTEGGLPTRARSRSRGARTTAASRPWARRSDSPSRRGRSRGPFQPRPAGPWGSTASGSRCATPTGASLRRSYRSGSKPVRETSRAGDGTPARRRRLRRAALDPVRVGGARVVLLRRPRPGRRDARARAPRRARRLRAVRRPRGRDRHREVRGELHVRRAGPPLRGSRGSEPRRLDPVRRGARRRRRGRRRHAPPHAGGSGVGRPGWTWNGGRTFLETRLELAAVVDSRGMSGDADAALDARVGRRSGKLAWALDLRANALVDGTGARTDLEGGPRLAIRVGDARTFSLFAHALRSRHPLGLRESGVLVGFEAAEDGVARGSARPSPPDLRGTVAAGIGGDDRAAGRLRLAILSPPWAERFRAVLDVDAHVLTATDTGELFYLYDLGVERASGRWVVGAYFHHRSNHVLAEENPEGVTSRNVAEVGFETSGWTGPARERVLDTRVRLGGLIDSSFGESTRWNLRAGARIAGPAWGRAVPWLALDLEEGDASARRAGAGLGFESGLEIRADYRREEQFFGSDDSAFTVGVAAYF